VPAEPILLDRADAAARELQGIAGAKEIAVDTEGASFHRFVDRIYLLQLSTPGRSAIIDPLAVDATTMAPLGALL
jgi:ribonuclease D